MACPAAATCLRMPGSYVACRPIGKKIALVQCAASAVSTACVFLGQGPSSKVSTTSPSRRKSWLLKCSNPKPGPPVVSISTTRAIPRALGFEHGGGEKAGQGEGGGEACAMTIGARVAAEACTAVATVAAVTDACRSTGPAKTGADDCSETDLFPNKMAPNTATHRRVASADAIAAKRMSDLQS